MKPRLSRSIRPETRQSSDEAEFWRRWPRASRYFPPEERQRYQDNYPGWEPGCDLNGLAQREPCILDPEDREEARRRIIELARKVGQ